MTDNLTRVSAGGAVSGCAQDKTKYNFSSGAF